MLEIGEHIPNTFPQQQAWAKPVGEAWYTLQRCCMMDGAIRHVYL